MANSNPSPPSTLSALSSATLLNDKPVSDDHRANGGTPTNDVQATLHALHADDLAQLAQNEMHQKGGQKTFSQKLVEMSMAYWIFMFTTWGEHGQLLYDPRRTIHERLTVLIYCVGSSFMITLLLLFCIVLQFPPVVFLLRTAGHVLGNNLSLVNAAYPQFFVALAPSQVTVAHISLAEPISASKSLVNDRIFDLDLARFLLQCSAVMYERSSAPVRAAVQQASKASASKAKTAGGSRARLASASLAPGQRANIILGEEGKEAMMKSVAIKSKEVVIQDWADRMKMKFAAISELNSTDSAFCGLFYDPTSTWIVVAFKGTNPAEFAEWTVDFAYTPLDASTRISGFGQVHGGFFRRLFPESQGAHGTPYDMIAKGVRSTARRLVRNCAAGQKVNVWFTGHSLGSAVSALAYACVLSEPEGFGDNVIVRDAYLFATPIVCDSQSSRAFTECMQETKSDNGQPFVRSMWRVTNRDDLVATGLPALGDKTPISSLSDLTYFAHLGPELKIGSKKRPSLVTGAGLDPKTCVTIHSKLPLTVVNEMIVPGLNPLVRFLQDVPLLGRMVAHWTPMYWDAITVLELGPEGILVVVKELPVP